MSHECEQMNNINKILDRVGDLEKSKARTEVLLETIVDTNKELSNTMKEIVKTMIQMQSSLKNNTEEISELNDKVDVITENDEKNKIDMREILKASFIKYGFGLAGAYGLYELISKVVEK